MCKIEEIFIGTYGDLRQLQGTTISQSRWYKEIISALWDTLFQKNTKNWGFYDQILPKSAPQEKQLIHMGDRVTCIGVFNANIVRFWWFLRWNDQNDQKIIITDLPGYEKISRQQYKWFKNSLRFFLLVFLLQIIHLRTNILFLKLILL